jgi:REP element-mobilizing transposase RayT
MPGEAIQPYRRSIRLQGFDYSQAGAYFVTIVTQGRLCLFGEIVNDEVHLNPAGQMVEKWWFELESKFPTVVLGTHVVMPNHFHGIIQIVGVDLGVDPIPGGHAGPPLRNPAMGNVDPIPGGHVGPPLRNPAMGNVDPIPGGHAGPPLRNPAMGNIVGVDLGVDPSVGSGGHAGPPLPTIIQWFKTMTTNLYIRGVKQLGWRPFPGKLWQRNYYEHIIRNDAEHNLIHLYIESNPANWLQDDENPVRQPQG